MKRFTILLLALGLSVSTSAQNSEIGLLGVDASFGLFSTNDELITGYEQDPNYDAFDDFGWEISENATFAYFIDFTFFRYKKIEAAVNFGYQQMSTTDAIYGQPDPVTQVFPTEEVNISVISFMPEMRVNWITAEDNSFQMYSGASFGLGFVTEKHSVRGNDDESYKMPAIHINGLGLRFGDKFAGFMELGMGSRGFMSFGFSYRY